MERCAAGLKREWSCKQERSHLTQQCLRIRFDQLVLGEGSPSDSVSVRECCQLRQRSRFERFLIRVLGFCTVCTGGIALYSDTVPWCVGGEDEVRRVHCSLVLVSLRCIPGHVE